MDLSFFKTPIAVRFKDIDAMGHVNNAVYVTYFEEARAAMARSVFGLSRLDDFDFVVARIEVDYRRPVLYGETLSAALRVAAIGRRSFTIEYILSAGEETVALGRSVQVFFDYAAGVSKAVPAGFREKAAPFMAPGA